MLRIGLACLIAATLLAACGGGGSSNGGSKISESDAATRNLSLNFNVALTRVQECLQADVDGRSPCTTNFKENRVSDLCGMVGTGKSDEFAGADFARFKDICGSWDQFANGAKKPAADALTDIQKLVDASKALQ